MSGKFELTKNASGKFHFNLLAGNGQVILTSEVYETKASAENGIESVRKNAADDNRYDRRESKAGQPYFALKAANGQIIGMSQMYSSLAAMENGIESVMTNGPTASTQDNT